MAPTLRPYRVQTACGIICRYIQPIKKYDEIIPKKRVNKERKVKETSPKTRIRVTEITIAAKGGTILSKKIGRAYGGPKRKTLVSTKSFSNQKIINKKRKEYFINLHSHRVADQKSTKQQMLILHYWKYLT